MIHIIRTNSNNTDFQKLVNLLNVDLAKRDGADHPLSQFNKIDSIKHVILAYENKKIIGCGAIKEYDANYMEIKRVFVTPENRRKGIANRILDKLENWTKELTYSKYVLIMGKNQHEAYELYIKNGYKLAVNFGKFIKINDSLSLTKEML